jgi:diaminohydroxyphosphoribosylaminopyrimidine deaminase/5-amino-6-(5-phosphoribosylamino)uracil reductase
MFALPALAHLSDKRPLRFHHIGQVGADVRILARFNNTKEPS